MKYKKFTSHAKTPTRATEGSAGYALYGSNTYRIEIAPHKTVCIDTSIAVEIPVGLFAGVFPRSGIATKRGIRLANCVAIIDEDYRGSIIIPLHNDSDEPQYVDPGERIAQLILLPYYLVDEWEEVDVLSKTDRGDGGFGSSGTV